MLKKLLKHEFRATGRTMLPMYLIVLVASLGANLTTRGLFETDYPFMDAVGVVLIMAFTAAIIAVCVMAFVTMIERFYRNLLKDEGYLAMTLPVSVHQQVWSKLLVSIVWFAATALVVGLAFFIMVFNLEQLHTLLKGFVDLFHEIWQHMSAYYALNGTAIFVELIILAFLALAAFCLRFYAAMAIGHSFANHKTALSVVFFFVIGAVLQFLAGLGAYVLQLTGLSDLELDLLHNGMAVTHLTFAALIISQLVLSGIFYFLTTYFLKNKLNLE